MGDERQSSAETFSASAPGRCGIVGNPSDIYGGFVVSSSIPERNFCRIRLSEKTLLPSDLRLWEAAVRRFPIFFPVAVEWKTDVPRSSGLSGSTALLAATMLCLLQAQELATELGSDDAKLRFAELVRSVERFEAGIMCGYQDAYMIVLGGAHAMDFRGKHPVLPGPFGKVTPITLPEKFLLVTTGVERLSGAVHGPMSQRWLAGEHEVVEAITRIAELGREGANAIRTEDWSGLAAMMNENHHLVAKVGGSGPQIDQLVSACLANGARAAKLAGAGLGGTVIAFADDPEELRARLSVLGYERFSKPFAQPGLQVGGYPEASLPNS